MDYQQEYDKIISQARSENRKKMKGGTYYEAHHIVPLCLGGEGKTSEWKTHPNIVLLTAKEHFFAHYYLMLANPKQAKLAHAFWKMCFSSTSQKRDQINLAEFADMYQKGKELVAYETSKRFKGKKIGPRSEEVKQKMRKPKSEAHKQKIREANLGKKRSTEAIEKTAAKNRGRSRPDVGARNRLLKSGQPTGRKGIPNPNRKKGVDQHLLDGTFVRTWEGIKDAARSLGISSIGECLAGRCKTAGGFVWKYSNH